MARIRLSDELRALLEEARTSGSLSLSELASQPSLSPNAAAFDEESLRILREEEASGALSTKSLRLLHAALRNHPKIASNDTSGSNDQSPGNQTTMLRAIAAGSKARAGENQSERLLLFPKSGGAGEAPTTRQTAEKEARRRLLQRTQETKEYNMMVFGEASDPGTVNLEVHNFQSMRHQLSIGANMIISAGGMFIVFYYIGNNLFTKKQASVMLGVAGAVGMLVIEMVLFILRTLQIDAKQAEEESRERRAREQADLHAVTNLAKSTPPPPTGDVKPKQL